MPLVLPLPLPLHLQREPNPGATTNREIDCQPWLKQAMLAQKQKQKQKMAVLSERHRMALHNADTGFRIRYGCSAKESDA